MEQGRRRGRRHSIRSKTASPRGTGGRPARARRRSSKSPRCRARFARRPNSD